MWWWKVLGRPSKYMLQSVGEERLLSSSSEKLLQMEEQQSVEIGASCSQKVAAVYQDSRCMDTTINVSVPDRIDPTEMFNFDEAYFRKCHDAKSNKSLSKWPGFAYYSFLWEKENEHFMRYNNGCEGARREGSCRCPYEIKGIPA